MTVEVIINKKESIERCIAQVRRYYALPSELPFAEDRLRQDAIAVNLQRMAEQAIDIANYVASSRGLGIPKSSRESFDLLLQAGIIDRAMADKMKGMVGFRNVLVHDYVQFDLKIMIEVIEQRLDDVINFTNQVLQFVSTRP